MLSKEVETLVTSLGGSDIEEPQERGDEYFNKRDHFLRSLAHQPNHKSVLGKVIGPQPETPRGDEAARIFAQWFESHLPIIRSRNQK